MLTIPVAGRLTIGAAFSWLLVIIWSMGFLYMCFMPKPDLEPVHVDFPVPVSQESQWVVPADHTFSGGGAHMVHNPSTFDFVARSQNKSTFCNITKEGHYHCAWTSDGTLHRAYVNKNNFLPENPFGFVWEDRHGSGTYVIVRDGSMISGLLFIGLILGFGWVVRNR